MQTLKAIDAGEVSLHEHEGDFYLFRIFRFCVGIIIISPALIMPYQIRTSYFKFVSFFVHLPFIVFGKFARFLVDKLYEK